MRKYICNACGIRICTAEYQSGSGIPMKCTALIDKYCKAAWQEVKEDNTQVNTQVASLPDWCKVGEWVYYKPLKKYRLITEIDDCFVHIETLDNKNRRSNKKENFIEYVLQVRVRPWTFEEASVFLKVKNKEGDYWLAKLMKVPVSGEWGYFVYPGVERHGFFIPFDSFVTIYTQLNGNPCGVLEHLENGEWVE